MYCIIKCTVQGKQARVKNADLRHPSCKVVMYKRKYASPILNVLRSNLNTSGGNSECMYVVGSISFRPDIQRPRHMQNALRDI